jgi:hypothetical protein
MSSGHGAARRRLVRELLLVAVLFLAYRLGRQALAGDLATAYANAAGIWHLERAWRLPNEAALQQTILGHGWPPPAPLPLGPHHPRGADRRSVRRSGPHPAGTPRLLVAGMVDTAAVVRPSIYTASTDAITNQYAAMPSLHVGWAAVVAIVLIRATGGRWRWLWLLHPLATLAVVVATANHYWLDAAVALTLLGAILLLPSRHSDYPQWIRVPIGRHAAAWFVGSRRVRPRGSGEPGPRRTSR